jgi:23S rRNA pseudouridine955/2504/2580 synthase
MKTETSMKLRAAADDDKRRLDRILRKSLDLPLSRLHRLLREGKVLVEGLPAGPALRVREGALIEIRGLRKEDLQSREVRALPGSGTVRETAPAPPAFREKGTGPALPLEILYEDPLVLALNKPRGLPVHGRNSLDILVREYLAPSLPPSLSYRPGPLHRLDQPTSGLILFAKSLRGARLYSALFRERRIIKRYLALAEGVLTGDEVWEDLLLRDAGEGRTRRAGSEQKKAAGGKTARTRVHPLGNAENLSLLLLELDTGRTHQIRAQASLRGHPLRGDKKYGGGFRSGGFLLHAWEMEFPPPPAAAFPQTLRAPLPEDFRKTLKRLFGGVEKGEAYDFVNGKI